ncbi:flavonoid 3'-monooxygenase-like [Ananas comosus]|uniref:trimethyltridecatetraene synthase n=1 Tax=Ananas comosus TaxID=4615 RepID=A0A6P5G943_ANACO|nr:flavonoid 3'-monooxygenase-like [Ananas comosus]
MAPFLLLLFTILLSFSLYYLFFSKKRSCALRLPPGPKGWPILGNLPQLGPKPHHTLRTLSEAHGPLFRLRFGSVDVVVASSAAVAAQFLKAHDANFSNRPPNSGAEHIAYSYRDLVFAPYGARWRALRKLCALHLFSGKALDDLRPIRAHEVGLMVRSLARWPGGSGGGSSAAAAAAVNVGEAANICATNALARALLGRPVFEEREEAREFKEMVVELMRLAGVFNVGDFVPWIAWLDPQGVVKKMKRLHRRYDEFLDRLIAERRREEAVGGGDFLGVLLSLTDQEPAGGQEEGRITDTDVKALLLNLFTAGTDTSSSTVEWALAELIRHPEILKQAQLELDSVVGRTRIVSESDLPNLPTLQAIIKETFRLHPSTPLSLPRIAAEACEIDGYCIPKRATLLVNVWAIARDPAIWPDPLEFRPARFLPGGRHENVDVKGSDFELIPFGAGRRICAGLSLGLRMVQLMTATLVHAFDWTLPDGQPPEKLDMEEAYGLTLQRAAPLVARPVPRLLPEAYVSIMQ